MGISDEYIKEAVVVGAVTVVVVVVLVVVVIGSSSSTTNCFVIRVLGGYTSRNVSVVTEALAL